MLMNELRPGDPFEQFRIETLVIRTSMTTIYRAPGLHGQTRVSVLQEF